jgi:hypothetical protein
MRRASRRVYAGVQILCVAARARFPVRFPDGTTMIGGRAGRRVVAGVPGAVAGAIAAAPWPLVVAVAAYLRAMMAPRALLNDPDTYLHIAAGQWFVAHRGLPAGDPFSFTAAGAPWLPGEWFGEVILAAAYRLGGWSAVVVLTALCCAAAFGLLARYLARRLDGLAAAVASLAGLALVQPHLVARPHVLALPLLVAWCGALFAARDARRGPPWRLLAAMPLWANLHASFLFGIALAGFLAGEAVLHPGAGRTRTREAGDWALFVAAAALLALLTPNGVGGLVQPFRLMAMPALQTSFGEWLPADFRAFPALALWLAGLVALCLWCGVRVPGTRLALLLLLVHMALSHVRHADLLGLVAPLALASAFAPTGRPAAPVSAAAVAAGLAVALAATLPLAARPLVRGDDPVTPASALAAVPHAGRVFNSEGFGGYLLFAGVPAFIDGRVELYGNEFLAAEVAAERGDESALIRLLAHYDIRWTLLTPGAGAVAVMDRLPGWHRAYADRYAVVHRRGR